MKNSNTNIYAIVKIGAEQLNVVEGKQYFVKKLAGNKGDKLVVKEVLLTSKDESVVVGKPFVSGASVTFEIAGTKKGEKMDVFKYAAKSRYRKSYGARAEFTKLLVKKIDLA